MTMLFRVELGHAMAFARAVGDEPPSHGDAVHPAFIACTVQHDPRHMLGLRPAGALGFARGMPGTVLHAEQEFEYFAPVVVGSLLTLSEKPGRSWEKTGSGGRTLAFRELVKELRDEDGVLMVRSRMVLVGVVEDGAEPR